MTATAVLDDAEYLQRSRQLNREGMTQLETGFRQLGLSWIPSAGNFVTVNFERDAGTLYLALLREGVIVRPLANYGMPRSLRISIGLPEENARFLQALHKVIAQ